MFVKLTLGVNPNKLFFLVKRTFFLFFPPVLGHCIAFELLSDVTNIVIMKVLYGLVLSLLLSVILSLSKVKRRQKANGQNHQAA